LAIINLKTCLLLENSRDVTGAFNAAMEITAALKERVDMEWALPSSASASITKRLVDNGITHHALPLVEIGRSWKKLIAYFPMLLANAVRLRGLLRSGDVGVLIVNDYYNLLGAAVRVLGWQGNLITYIRLLPGHQQPLLNTLWVWAAFKYSDSVIAVSQAVAKQLPKHAKLRLIYDPIEIARNRIDLASESKPQGATVRFLYLANYINGKGHLTALQAFHRAYAETEGIRLRFVGSDMGIQKNRVLKSALCSEVEKLGLNAVVEVLGPTDNVAQEILAADVLLNFSESESFSRTCLEGSAYGRPVIATCCGGPEEIIESEVSGVLVPVGDVPAIAGEILRLAGDSQLRKKMGRAGKNIVQYCFSAERFIREFSCVLETKRTEG
jgi:L-malate glycosyltransferase